MLVYRKIFVPCHQRVTSAEENLNTQVDRMTHSVDTSQLFFPATLSLPNELMNRVAMLAGTQVMHALSNMDFHSPRSTWLWLLNAQYDTWNNQHCLQCYHFSGHQLPGGRLITLDHFQHGRNIMFLLEYTLTLDYGSAFPEWNASAKTIIHGLVF